MSAIWENSGGGWSLVAPSGFPDEQTLHDLVEDAPHVLPLSGSPDLVVLGREVPLGGGSADLLAVESSGRLAVIEIKLRRNPEARRAVAAQVLSYASALYGMELDVLENEVLASQLASRGHASIAAAVSQDGTDGDPVQFSEALSECLATGSFRLVLVLDEAPPDLVRLVGYLEAQTTGLVVDLVVVAAHEIAGSSVIVPTRIEPGREIGEAKKRLPNALTSASVTSPGATDFRVSIDSAPSESQAALLRLCDWAESLGAARLANLSTKRGRAGGRWVLRLRVPRDGSNICVLWNEGGPSIAIWRSVLERLAPMEIDAIESAFGAPLRTTTFTSTREVSDELLSALGRAYEAAASHVGAN